MGKQLKEGKPFFNSILVSFYKEKFYNIKTKEWEEKDYSKPHTLQQVVQTGANASEVVEGDWVLINSAIVERGGIPVIQLDGESYAILSERDLLYNYGKNKPFEPGTEDTQGTTDSAENIDKKVSEKYNPLANESDSDFMRRMSEKKRLVGATSRIEAPSKEKK